MSCAMRGPNENFATDCSVQTTSATSNTLYVLITLLPCLEQQP